MLREILDQTAKRLDDLKGQPSVDADLRATLGRVYYDLAEYAKAVAMHRQALAMREKLLGSEHPDVIGTRNDLGTLLVDEGKPAQAETIFRETLNRLPKPSPTDPSQETAQVGLLLHHLANALRVNHALTEARSLAEEADAMYRRHPDWSETEMKHAREILEAVLTDLMDSASASKR